MAPASADEIGPGAVHVPVPAADASSSLGGNIITEKEKEEIQKLLSGYQIDEDCGTAEVEVVDDEEARNQRFQEDLQKECRKNNMLYSFCVVVTSLELLYWSFGGDDGYLSFLGGLIGCATGMNAFGFAYICLLLLIEYRLQQHSMIPVDECIVLNKVTKRFCCCDLFQKTHHVLVRCRVTTSINGSQQQKQKSYLKIFPVTKSRYNYVRIGESLGDHHVYCRQDNPKVVVYEPPEWGSEWRKNVIRVGSICFGLHWIGIAVAFAHPKVSNADAFFFLYHTLAWMVICFPYLFVIVLSIARRKYEDYNFPVEQATVVHQTVDSSEQQQEQQGHSTDAALSENPLDGWWKVIWINGVLPPKVDLNKLPKDSVKTIAYIEVVNNEWFCGPIEYKLECNDNNNNNNNDDGDDDTNNIFFQWPGFGVTQYLVTRDKDEKKKDFGQRSSNVAFGECLRWRTTDPNQPCIVWQRVDGLCGSQ